MALKGVRDLSSLVMMTGWDATALQNFALQDGTTYAAVVAQLNAGLGALNAELFNDPLWASLVSYSDRPDIKYRVGAGSSMNKFTEYARADSERADREGHMAPLQKWDHSLGWTWSYLKEARADEVQMDIRNGLDAVRNRYRKMILGRLLQRGDDSGASKGLGTGGYSPGFATTAASTNVDFVPPDWGGNTFASTHEHYVPIAGGAFTAAVFTDANAELREHGHEPNYTFLIGSADAETVKGLTGFVGTASNLITYGNAANIAIGNSVATTPSGWYPIGTISDFLVYVVPGMPQYYGVGFKSYGPNSSMNPLRVRLEKGFTRPQVIAMPDPRSGSGAYPLQAILLYTEMGVGVADRTAGTPRYVNNAAWSDGTAT